MPDDRHGRLRVAGNTRSSLRDTKARQQVMSLKREARRARKGTPAQSGSRRWKRLRRNQRRAENAHRRRIRQAQHTAANQVVAWAVERQVGTLVVGDPEGICGKDSGRAQNKRLRDWMRTHLVDCLKDEAIKAGIVVVEVDERGTSSTCPACKQRVSKAQGSAVHLSLLWLLRAPRWWVPATSPRAIWAGTWWRSPPSSTVEWDKLPHGVTEGATSGTSNGLRGSV